MKNDLLGYYQHELAAIYKLANEFASAHPHAGNNLKLGTNKTDDPHVARLLDGFAFLNARTQAKLDDGFTAVAENLFNVIYPHFQKPIPACAIAQINFDDNLLQKEIVVNKNSVIESDEYQKVYCKFRTTFNVVINPFILVHADIAARPLKGPIDSNNFLIAGSICLHLRRLSQANENINNLTFYINAPLLQASLIYELIFNNCVNIAIANSDNEGEHIFLDANALESIGFSKDDLLVAEDTRSFIGYNLLTEFFVLPEKFLFFKINFANKPLLQKLLEKECKIYIYLNNVSFG